MTRLIRVVGVGGYLPSGGPHDRVQRLPRGWQGALPDEIAEKWIAAGVAVSAEDDAPDQGVSTDAGTADAKPIDAMTAKELRSFAAAHEPAIEIPASAKKVGEVRAVVLAAVDSTPADDNGDDDGLPDPLPADLGDLTEEQLVLLAVEWDLDVPEDTDRDQLLELVRTHAAEHTEPAE